MLTQIREPRHGDRQLLTTVIGIKSVACPALRLICFPHAGAGARTFRPWAPKFPADIEVLEMKLAGRDIAAGEKPIRRMAPLVESACSAIVPFLDRPYTIFGHSLGALAAFEVARRLRGLGQPSPDLVVVSGCPTPLDAMQTPKTGHMSEGEFCAHLRDAYHLPEELLSNAELMAIALPLIRAEFEIYETYEYVGGEPLGSPVVALCGDRDPLVRPQEMSGWATFTRSWFAEHVVAGDHFFPLTASAHVAAVIRPHIERVLAR